MPKEFSKEILKEFPMELLTELWKKFPKEFLKKSKEFQRNAYEKYRMNPQDYSRKRLQRSF